MSVSGYINQDVYNKLISNQAGVSGIKEILADLRKSGSSSFVKVVNPFVYINRKDEIKKIRNFLSDENQRLLLVGGIQGSGKTSLVKSSFVTCPTHTLIYLYECSKITNLDDLLLSLCAFFDKKVGKIKQITKDRLNISIDERLISYLKNLDRPLIVVIDSFEHLVSTNLTINDDELKSFFNFLLSNKLIKLILIGQRLPSEDMDYNESFISEIRIAGLTENNAIELLRKSGLDGSNSVLTRLYEYARGYPWVLLLASTVCQKLEVLPEKLVQEMSISEESFEAYLVKLMYDKLPEESNNILKYLSVFRHPINVPVFNNLDQTLISPEQYLDDLYRTKLVQATGKRYYVNNSVRKIVYSLIPYNIRYLLHKDISTFYSNEISKKLSDRTVRLSRKLLHSEQYFHNMTATQINIDKDKYEVKLPPTTSKTTKVSENYFNNDDLKDVDSSYLDEKFVNYPENIQQESFIQSQQSNISLENDFSVQQPELKVNSQSNDVVDLDGLELHLSEEELELLKETDSANGELSTDLFKENKVQNDFVIKPEKSEEESLDFEIDFDTKEHGIESSDIDLVESLRFVAKGYASENKHNIALDRYKEALEICERHQNIIEIAKTLIPMAESYMFLKQYDTAIEFYEKAKNIFLDLSDYTDIPFILTCQGNVYAESYQHEKAIQNYNEVLKMPQEYIQNHTRASVYLGLGEIYDYRHNLNEALDYYFKALKSFREINDKLNQAILYSRIALIYDDMGDFEKAIKYYEISLELDKMLGRKQTYAATLSNLASVYDEQGRKSKALGFYKQSLIIDKELNNIEGLYKTLSRVGTIYIELGNINKAMKYYQQELKVAKSVSDPYWIAMAYIDLGDLYYFINEFDKSAKCFLISQKVISKSISTDSREKIERRIRKIQEHLPKTIYENIKKKVYKQ